MGLLGLDFEDVTFLVGMRVKSIMPRQGIPISWSEEGSQKLNMKIIYKELTLS